MKKGPAGSRAINFKPLKKVEYTSPSYKCSPPNGKGLTGIRLLVRTDTYKRVIY